MKLAAMIFIIRPIILLALTTSLATAQENDPKDATEKKPIAAASLGVVDEVKPVTESEIDAKLKDLESRELDEATLATLKESYGKAKLQVQTAAKLGTQVAEYKKKSNSSINQLAEIQAQLKESFRPAKPAIDSKSQTELQSELADKNVKLEQSRRKLTRLSSEPSRRQARLLEIPKLLNESQTKLDEARSQIRTVGTAGPSDDDGEDSLIASTILQRARYHTGKLEIACLEAERNYYSATAESLPLQRQLAESQIGQLEKEVEKWQAAIGEMRTDRIADLGRAAKSLFESMPAELKPAAMVNQNQLEKFKDKSKQLAKIQSDLNEVKSKLKEVQTNFKKSEQRIDAVGLNNTLGLMLRRNKPELASLRNLHLPTSQTSTDMETLQVELFALEDLFARAADNEEAVAMLLDSVEVPADKRQGLADEAREILAQRREVLTPLMETQSELFQLTLDLDTSDRMLVVEIDKFTDYINEHILWIRSAPIFGQGEISSLSDATLWLTNPSNLPELANALAVSARKKLGLLIVLSTVLCGLLFFQRRLRRNITNAGNLAKVNVCRDFAPTLNAAINTTILAASWPLLLVAVGWLLLNVGGNGFVQAAPRSLIIVGLAIFPFELLRRVCRTDGLAEHHFGWTQSTRKFLRANLRWLNPMLVVLLFLVVLFQHQPDESFRNSLGRLIMIALIGLWGVYIWKVLHPNGQLYRVTSAEGRQGHWYRYRWVRFYLACSVVFALLIFTLGGYYYSTYEIGSRLIQSHALLVGFVFCYEIAMRWLLVRRRNLKMEQMALRRAELTKQANAEAALGSQVKIDIQAEQGIDAESVSKQTRQLLFISLASAAIWIAWKIWADVIPAIGILDKVDLWKVMVAGAVETVTLQHAVLCVLTLTITAVAVKNLPGILELLLLKRLPLDSGSRYAVATIVRYLVTLVGVIIACSFLKIQWSQFSWLLAAISVGLGFGLQEIVANFVSGLILLLERPVRIGDVVTIEGTTGVVTKIQMRATTVTNWDQQELVVPNKNLITNSIFNWTLSNVLTRISLDVGVAYGTDPEKTRDIIMDVVKSNPRVIEDPAPSVTFQTFGDSSLNFVVRCCISGPDKRLSTIHDLQVGINRQLAEHNIEIPFPQRVLHTISHPPAIETNEAANLADPKV